MEPVLLRRKQAAQRLGVSVRTIRRMEQARRLMPRRLVPGGHPYYCRAEVDALVDLNGKHVKGAR